MKFTVSNIKKAYKKSKNVLSDVSFSFESGECIGILGANGCGKSTLLNILSGIISSDGGSFELDGKNLFKNKKLREKTLSFVPQTPPLIDELSAKDNLSIWYGKDELEASLKSGILKKLEIDTFIKVPVSKMSGGMKKRLSIGCALANKPSLLLLDEPSAALDLIGKAWMAEYIADFKSYGGAVIIATHDVGELEVCDRLYIMKNGTLSPYENDGNIKKLVSEL